MWGPLVRPLGQTNKNGSIEPNQPHPHPSQSLSLATSMATRSPAASSACGGRLRPPLTMPPPSNQLSPSALPLHYGNRAMVLAPLWPARVRVSVCSSSLMSYGLSPWLGQASWLTDVTLGHWIERLRGAAPRWLLLQGDGARKELVACK
jgi:hypothetical protein